MIVVKFSYQTMGKLDGIVIIIFLVLKLWQYTRSW